MNRIPHFVHLYINIQVDWSQYSFFYIHEHLTTSNWWGASWSWSHGSWIYNYLCNQCLSPRCELKHRSCEVYSIQHYVIKFVGGFLQYSCFLHQQNWPPRYNWNIVENGVNHHRTNQPMCGHLVFINYIL